MSGFQEQLEKEIDKRGLRPPKDPVNKSIFSILAFIKGSVICTLFLSGVIGWAWLNTDSTIKKMQDKLPSKTAIIQKDVSEVFRLGETQPTLTMPAVDLSAQPIAPEENQAEPLTIKPIGDGKDALVAAPIPGLYESIAVGLIPKPRDEDNLTPFEAYKRPFQKQADKPLLSFIIVDAGLSRKRAEKIISDFPPEITLALSPYSRDLKLLTDVARQDGHEVWLTLPLETKNYPLDDPGPSSLLVNASVEQNKSRLTSLLASTQGYVGFVSQKDHVFKREDAAVNPSLQEIFERGLAVIDSNPSLYSFVGDIASRRDYPNAKNNVWFDEDLSPLALNQKTRQMIEFAEANGQAIVMLRPNPSSLKALNKFLKSAALEKFQLAPASAQIKYGE